MTNYRYDWDKKEKECTNPDHYSGLEIEPLDYIIKNKMDFLEGNIIKYVTRYKNKNGVDDLIKAKKYLDKLIERERACLHYQQSINSLYIYLATPDGTTTRVGERLGRRQ